MYFPLLGTILSLSFHPFSPPLPPLLHGVLFCSVSCPKPLVDFAAVSRLRRFLWPPPERHWAAKGGQSPQVNPPSTGAGPARCGRAGRGTRWASRGLGLFPLFPSVAGGLRGRGSGPAALFGPQHVWGRRNRCWLSSLGVHVGVKAPGALCHPAQRDPQEWRLQASPGHSLKWDLEIPQNSQGPEGQWEATSGLLPKGRR